MQLDISYVFPMLALGSQPEDLGLLAREGITHVICLRDDYDEAPAADRAGLTLLQLPWSDHRSMQANLPASLPRLLDFVDAALTQPDAVVFIHCAAGIERTPLAAYVLLRANGMTDDEARRAIKKARPQSVLTFVDANSYAVENFLDSRGLR